MKIPKRYSHIRSAITWTRSFHSDKYKTAISSDKPYLHIVATRVNYITAHLWLQDRNDKLKRHGVLPDQNGFCGMPKVNWLTMIGNWRREQDQRIKTELNENN